MSGPQLHFVETIDDAFELLRRLDKPRDVLGLDIETTGLRWWMPGYKITLAQIAVSDNEAFMFQPERFGVLFDDILKKYTGRIVGQNLLGFDFHALKACGYPLPDLRLVDDLLIMSKMVDSDQKTHGLDDIIKRYVGPEASKAKHILDDAFDYWGLRPHARGEEGERAWTEIARIGPDAFFVYSGMDAVSAVRAWRPLKAAVERDYKEPYLREMGAWALTFEAAHRGVRVDLDWAARQLDELDVEIDILRNQLAVLGLPNPGSRKKLIEKLKEEGWEPKDFNKKSGDPSTKKAIIQDLDIELVEPLMEWNRLTHWRTAYVKKVLDSAHNGRVYPNVNPMEAVTGREAMSSPPLHQIPKRHADAWKMRRMFLPELGEKMISIDYQAQENRLTAHFSQDPLLMKIINEGLDIHKYNAAAIFQVHIENVTGAQRDVAKTYAYASGYGAQDKKLASVLGVHEREMPVIRERVNEAFGGVAAYVNRITEEAEEMFASTGKAYVKTMSGRKLYIESKRGHLMTTTIANYPNQGTGADIAKEAKNRIAAADLGKHMMFFMHDEVLLSVPAGDDGTETAQEVARLMEFPEGDTTFGEPFRIAMTTSVGDQFDYWGSH